MELPSYKSSILLTKSYRILRSRAYETLRSHELNATEWSIIGLVYESENGITLSGVAKSIGIKKPLVTLLVDKLVQRKLIMRSPNKDDSRSKLLMIKPEGRVLIEAVEGELGEGFKSLFDDLTNGDIANYVKVLETIIKNDQTTGSN
jgi:MarR family transcriptional regulator for hemolysin